MSLLLILITVNMIKNQHPGRFPIEGALVFTEVSFAETMMPLQHLMNGEPRSDTETVSRPVAGILDASSSFFHFPLCYHMRVCDSSPRSDCKRYSFEANLFAPSPLLHQPLLHQSLPPQLRTIYCTDLDSPATLLSTSLAVPPWRKTTNLLRHPQGCSLTELTHTYMAISPVW